MKSRLAFFMPNLAGGGAEKVMLQVAGGLADRGHEVTFVLGEAVGPRLPTVHPSVRIHDSRRQRVLSSVPGLVRYLRREQPDAVLSCLDYANLAALGAVGSLKTRPRLVLRLSNHVSTQWNREANLRARAVFLLVAQFYRRADAVVALTTQLARDIRQLAQVPLDRLHVIPNPVVIEELSTQIDVQVHPWLSGPEPVVVGCGRLTRAKDYPTFLEAIALANRTRSIRALVLGGGELKEALSARLASMRLTERVQFLGHVDNPYATIAKASCLALSSAWEGFPNVLVEALALGCPIVSTDARGAGPDEILGGGAFGRLVPTRDPHQLAAGILETLDRPIAPERLKARAAVYGLGRVIDKYERVLGVADS